MSWKKKLRSQRGVTLTELLVAMVVLSLLSMAVTVGISSGIHTYRMSTTLSRTQSMVSTLSKAVSDELRFAQDIRVGSGGALDGYTSPAYGGNARLEANADGRLTVSSDAMAEAAPLVGSGTYGAFTAGVAVNYDEVSGCFEVKLSVYEKAGADAVQTLEFAVRALNA